MDVDNLGSDELVARWRSGVGVERERAGVALLERYEKVVRGIVRDEATGFGVHVPTKQERHNLSEDLFLVVFEAAGTYDPDKSGATGDGFEHWLRYTLRNHLASMGGGGGAVDIPDSWQRVGRIAARVTQTLTQKLRRTPTFDEIRAGTLAHATEWAKERLREAGATGNLDVAAAAKLRKQGTLGAIEQLEQVLAYRAGAVDFDHAGVDRAEADRPATTLEAAMAMLTPTERFAAERRFGLWDGQEWNFEEIGDELSIHWTEVRRMLAAALTKPRLPHAQFIYLAGIDGQVDELDIDGSDDPVARFRVRVGAAAD
jgi:DNA-directed RNA polymerase specialized sigma subunit